jgi:hypothetical protein
MQYHHLQICIQLLYFLLYIPHKFVGTLHIYPYLLMVSFHVSKRSSCMSCILSFDIPVRVMQNFFSGGCSRDTLLLLLYPEYIIHNSIIILHVLFWNALTVYIILTNIAISVYVPILLSVSCSCYTLPAQ